MFARYSTFALALIAGLGLAGCAEMGEMTKSMSSSVGSMFGGAGGQQTGGGTDDQTRTKAEGALGGALLGALAGVAAGGDAKSALIGAVVGGGLGYVVGNEIAKRKQAYATREELLNGEIARTAETIAQVKAANASLQNDLAQSKKEIRRLTRQAERDAGKKAELRQQKTKLEARYQDAKQAVEGVEKELEVSQALYEDTKKSATGADQLKLRTWEKRIAELKLQKVELEEKTGQLQAVSNSIAM